jgi:hypothetical protein
MSDFQAFLKEHKIDTESLRAAGKEGEVLNGDEAAYTQLKEYQRVMNPFNAADEQRHRMQGINHHVNYSMRACTNMCGNLHSTPFLTPEEGMCFRNCVGKFWNFQPEWNKAFQGSNAAYLEEEFNKKALAKMGLSGVMENPRQE